MTQINKAEILERNIKSSGLGVGIRRMRFPLVDGTQHKVTLVSNRTGEFMNIGFHEGKENTIIGYVADRLLDDFPGVFRIAKINGKAFTGNTKETERDTLKREIMNELKSTFDLVPKELRTVSRDRKDEPASQGKSPVKKEETKKSNDSEKL